MKKLLLLITFAALTLGIFAQTGIWGLAYNQSIDDARSIMKSKGFTISEENDTMISYTNPTMPSVEKVTLKKTGTGEKLRSWIIDYKGNNESTLKQTVFDELNKIHGDISYFDDYWEEWVWELENDMAIYVYISSDGIISVEYTEFYYDDYWW